MWPFKKKEPADKPAPKNVINLLHWRQKKGLDPCGTWGTYNPETGEETINGFIYEQLKKKD